MRQAGGRDADPGVADTDRNFSAFLPDGQTNLASRLAVFGRIIQQVYKDLHQTRNVALNENRAGRGNERKSLAGALNLRLAHLNDIPQHNGKVEMVFANLQLARRDATHIEQVVHQLGKLMHLTSHHQLSALRRAGIGGRQL